MTAIDLAIVVAGILPIALTRDLRTPRATLFIVAVASVFLVGSALAQPAQFVVKVGTVLCYTITVLWFQHVLAGRSREEAAFDRVLRRIVRDVNDATRGRTVERTGDQARQAAILDRIAALHAPTPEWAEVLRLLDADVRARLSRGNRLTSPDTASPASSAPAVRPREEDLLAAWKDALRPSRRTRD